MALTTQPAGQLLRPDVADPVAPQQQRRHPPAPDSAAAAAAGCGGGGGGGEGGGEGGDAGGAEVVPGEVEVGELAQARKGRCV